jgi:ATP-dependent protease ClpP protease subunit
MEHGVGIYNMMNAMFVEVTIQAVQIAWVSQMGQLILINVEYVILIQGMIARKIAQECGVDM